MRNFIFIILFICLFTAGCGKDASSGSVTDTQTVTGDFLQNSPEYDSADTAVIMNVNREENKITSWMLKNTISGEEIRFSTKYHNNNWFGEQLRVAFENLLQIPCQIKACNERAGFISNILMKHWDEITWIK